MATYEYLYEFIEEGGKSSEEAEDNRVRQYLSDLNNQTNDQEEMMLEIMDALNDTVTPIPEVGGFYTFVYLPKTPMIEYDEFPLIACMEIQRWGFRGFNYHWGKMRNYTWAEVIGEFHELSVAEFVINNL